MGLAASQARYLQLTARRSDLEYEAQQINQSKTGIMEQLNQVSDKYNEKIADRILYYKPCPTNAEADTELVRLNYDCIVNSMADGGLGMRLVDLQGNIITPGVDNSDDTVDVTKYIIEPNCLNPDYLESKIRSGEWLLQQPQSREPGNWVDVNWSMSSQIYDNLYKDNDATAEAEYTAASQRLHNQDVLFDLRLKEIETEHSALQNEIDSISKVIEKNIETSFSTFKG